MGFISCRQSSIVKSEAVAIENSNSGNNIQYDKEIYTQNEYRDADGKRIIIQNAYPRGGRKYTDPKGNACAYAVFWTRIINETDNSLELNIDFPLKSYEISNFPGKYFKILVPPDTMTPENTKDLNLTALESFFDANYDQSSSVKRTIHPNESSGFYVAMLILTEEATGMTRTELKLKGQDLIYTISRYPVTKPSTLIDEIEIHCGRVNLENLVRKN